MPKKSFDLEKFLPLDKSWIIRMGVLDLINNEKNINNFLENKSGLADDLVALKRVSKSWWLDRPLDVGESGTLYRFLQFVSWKKGLNKIFVKRGTLRERNISSDHNLVGYGINDLLKLDSGTSQWASAAVLLGNKEKIKSPPYKLKLTYDAVKHWSDSSKKGKTWLPRYDSTIKKQAQAFLSMLEKNKKPKFEPIQAEDFCFAYTFGYVSKKEAEKKWPSLRGHESNRIVEIQKMLDKVYKNSIVDSRDHRVVQALAMKGIVDNKRIKFKYPNVVKKSWPSFWKFMEYSKSIKKD